MSTEETQNTAERLGAIKHRLDVSMYECVLDGSADVFLFKDRGGNVVRTCLIPRESEGPQEWDERRESIWQEAWSVALRKGVPRSSFDASRTPISKKEAEDQLRELRRK